MWQTCFFSLLSLIEETMRPYIILLLDVTRLYPQNNRTAPDPPPTCGGRGGQGLPPTSRPCTVCIFDRGESSCLCSHDGEMTCSLWKIKEAWRKFSNQVWLQVILHTPSRMFDAKLKMLYRKTKQHRSMTLEEKLIYVLGIRSKRLLWFYLVSQCVIIFSDSLL